MLFDEENKVTDQIFNFIESANEQAESVLVHSVRGQSRSSCVIAAYLMQKYRWSLLKTLEFLNSRRQDLEIRVSFIQQLSAFEARLLSKNLVFTKKWSELQDENKYLESEELILRNTFINSKTT